MAALKPVVACVVAALVLPFAAAQGGVTEPGDAGGCEQGGDPEPGLDGYDAYRRELDDLLRILADGTPDDGAVEARISALACAFDRNLAPLVPIWDPAAGEAAKAAAARLPSEARARDVNATAATGGAVLGHSVQAAYSGLVAALARHNDTEAGPARGVLVFGLKGTGGEEADVVYRTWFRERSNASREAALGASDLTGAAGALARTTVAAAVIGTRAPTPDAASQAVAAKDRGFATAVAGATDVDAVVAFYDARVDATNVTIALVETAGDFVARSFTGAAVVPWRLAQDRLTPWLAGLNADDRVEEARSLIALDAPDTASARRLSELARALASSPPQAVPPPSPEPTPATVAPTKGGTPTVTPPTKDPNALPTVPAAEPTRIPWPSAVLVLALMAGLAVARRR